MKTNMYLDMDTGEWIERYEYEPGEAPDLEELFAGLELIDSITIIDPEDDILFEEDFDEEL